MTWHINLPDMPIITPNSRTHWSKRAECARNWRTSGHLWAKQAKVPRLKRVAVTLTCWPPDRRRRDSDSISLVCKWLIDGLVDALVVPDDDSSHVVSTTCRMEPTKGDKRRHWMLTIEEVA